MGKEQGRLPVPVLLVAGGGCAVTTARWCSPAVCLCSPVPSARLLPSLRDALDLHAKGFQSCTQSQRPSMHSQCPCPPARYGCCAPWHVPAPWASVCPPQPGPVWLRWRTGSHHVPAASTAAARCPGSCVTYASTSEPPPPPRGAGGHPAVVTGTPTMRAVEPGAMGLFGAVGPQGVQNMAPTSSQCWGGHQEMGLPPSPPAPRGHQSHPCRCQQVTRTSGRLCYNKPLFDSLDSRV